MRVVQYLRRYRFEDGGVTRAVVDLCGALLAHGQEVTTLTYDATDWPDDGVPPEARPTVEILPPSARLGPLFRGARRGRLRRLLAGADVVHLHIAWDATCRLIAGEARKAGVPYVVSIHGMLDDWCMGQKSAKKRLYLALAGRRLLEDAAAVHCTAQAERDQSSKWYPRGRPVVVPLLFDLSPYRALPGPGLARERYGAAIDGGGEPIVLFLSRLHPKKRLELLIEAAARLRDAGLAFRVVVAGTGEPAYERELRRLVEARGLGDRVAFVGFVSGDLKLSLYQAADLFVLPTSQENWGFVFMESLACGTPVVTTRGVDTWPELEASGGAAIVEEDASDLDERLRGLLADGDLSAMGERGRGWVLETLEPDRVVGQYAELYEDVVRRRRAASPPRPARRASAPPRS